MVRPEAHAIALPDAAGSRLAIAADGRPAAVPSTTHVAPLTTS